MARRKKQEIVGTDVPVGEGTLEEEENHSASQVVEVVDEQSGNEEGSSKPTEEISAPEEQTEESPELPKEQKEVVEELFQEEASQVPTAITTGSNGSRKGVLLWALIVIIVAVLVGGGLIWVVRGRGGIPFFGASPTPTPTVTPTPTPSAELKREVLSVQVLNGGGVAGAAGKMKTFLEGKGYTVSNVGNTEEYTYEKTEIHVKADKGGYLALLTQDLSEQYSVGSSSADLEENVAYDARIIIGKE